MKRGWLGSRRGALSIGITWIGLLCPQVVAQKGDHVGQMRQQLERIRRPVGAAADAAEWANRFRKSPLTGSLVDALRDVAENLDRAQQVLGHYRSRELESDGATIDLPDREWLQDELDNADRLLDQVRILRAAIERTTFGALDGPSPSAPTDAEFVREFGQWVRDLRQHVGRLETLEHVLSGLEERSDASHRALNELRRMWEGTMKRFYHAVFLDQWLQNEDHRKAVARVRSAARAKRRSLAPVLAAERERLVRADLLLGLFRSWLQQLEEARAPSIAGAWYGPGGSRLEVERTAGGLRGTLSIPGTPTKTSLIVRQKGFEVDVAGAPGVVDPSGRILRLGLDVFGVQMELFEWTRDPPPADRPKAPEQPSADPAEQARLAALGFEPRANRNGRTEWLPPTEPGQPEPLITYYPNGEFKSFAQRRNLPSETTRSQPPASPPLELPSGVSPELAAQLRAEFAKHAKTERTARDERGALGASGFFKLWYPDGRPKVVGAFGPQTAEQAPATAMIRGDGSAEFNDARYCCVGRWRTYHENGQLRSERSWIGPAAAGADRSRRVGTWRTLDEQGRLIARDAFHGATGSGRATRWDAEGRVVASGALAEGVADGAWIERRFRPGEVRPFVRSRGEFKAGAKHGAWTVQSFDASGRVVGTERQNYRAGLLLAPPGR